MKYGLTRGLTADLTVNTDFAQVEEDQQQINLTRFSLFFPEKRDFFLEGQGIFDFGGQSGQRAGTMPILFFSRRIGLSSGQAVPVIAGGRVTGKAGASTSARWRSRPTTSRRPARWPRPSRRSACAATSCGAAASA